MPKPSKKEALLNELQIMLDLETMGTSADSPIIAIGAVPFSFKKGPQRDLGFYTSIKLDDVLASGAKVSGDTICWWMEQKDAARSRFFPKTQASEALPLESTLKFFGQWVAEISAEAGHARGSRDSASIWGNGPSFDCGMLSETYRRMGLPTPWAFWRERCMRTYNQVGEALGIHKGQFSRDGTAHNALDDAVFQAKVVAAIGRTLLREQA